jgi:O-antigen/teichoic acid export membrane protein
MLLKPEVQIPPYSPPGMELVKGRMNDLEEVAGKSARGSLYLFLGSFISEAINAIGVVVVSRFLTPGEFGLFGLTLVLPGIFLMFTNWGIGSALTRFLARYAADGQWDNARRAVYLGYLFKGTVSLFLSAILFLFSEPLASFVLKRPDLSGLVRMASVLVVLQSLYVASNAIFYGLERMRIIAIILVLQSVVKTSSSYFLLIRGYGVTGALSGHILGFGVGVITAFLLIFGLVLKGKTTEGDRGSTSSLSEMLRFGFPLFLGNFVTTMGMRYQGLLLAWFTSDIEIGNLNIANKFVSLITLFTVPIASVVYPAFSKFNYKEQPVEMERLFKASVRYATLLVIPATALIMVLSEDFVYTLFDRRYTLAPEFLVLVLLKFLVVGIGSLSVYSFLNSQGDTATTFRLNLLNVALKVSLCTFLIWKMGAPGLLLALFISELIGRAVNLYTLRARYGINVDLEYLTKVVAFTAPSAMATYTLLRTLDFSVNFLNITLSSTIFLILCMILAPLTGALGFNDIHIIRRLMKREPIIYPLISPFLSFEERIIAFIGREKTDEGS